MKPGPTPEQRVERRKKAIAMAENHVPITEITKLIGVSRQTVMKWLKDAGVEPTMLRQQRSPRSGGTSLSAGKALSIEEGVRKRIEAMEEPPDEAA